jgi:L-lactate dehydrogenase complex protein LldF
MHTEQAEKFLERSAEMAPDLDHRKKINFNIGKYNAVVPQGKAQFEHIELARKKAKNLKWRAIEKLDRYLEQFDFNFTRNGAKSFGRRQLNKRRRRSLTSARPSNAQPW